MGSLVKAKRFTTESSLGAGVHLVIISDIRYAKDEKGNYRVKPSTGEMAIEITFKDGKGNSINNIFWLTEASQWVFDNLCKAADVNNKTETPSVNELINKRIFIMVGVRYEIKDGILQRSSDGHLICHYKLIPTFYKVWDPTLPPAIDGEPRLNNGIPHGKFLLNDPEEVPFNFEEQIHSGWNLVMSGNSEPLVAANTQTFNPTIVSNTNHPDSPF